MLTFVIIGVGVAALAGFVLLLRWPPSEPTAESDEDRQEAPPIIDLSGG